MRDASRKCPACQGAFIIKGKEEYGGGWLCFKKKGGCGTKFLDGDPIIESQPEGKVPNENVWEQENTILKMAAKRAKIAATINAIGISDLFTQDIEDMAEFQQRDKEENPEPAHREGHSHASQFCKECSNSGVPANYTCVPLKGHLYIKRPDGSTPTHEFKDDSFKYCPGCKAKWDKLSDAERNKEMGIEVPPSNPPASPGTGEGGTGAGASGDAAPSKESPVPPGAPSAGDSGAAIGSSPLAALPDESPAKKQFLGRMKALAIKNSEVYHQKLLGIGPSEGYEHATEVPENRLDAVEAIVRKAVEEAGPAKRRGRLSKQAPAETGVSQASEPPKTGVAAPPAPVSSIPVDCQVLWAEVYKIFSFEYGEDMKAFVAENFDVPPDAVPKIKPTELKAFLELALVLNRDVNEATRLKRFPGNGSFSELLAYLKKSFSKESWLRALTIGDIPGHKVWEAIRKDLEPPEPQRFSKEDYEFQLDVGDVI